MNVGIGVGSLLIRTDVVHVGKRSSHLFIEKVDSCNNECLHCKGRFRVLTIYENRKGYFRIACGRAVIDNIKNGTYMAYAGTS